MGVIGDIFSKIWTALSTYIGEASWLKITMFGLGALIVFTAIGLVLFFWWIIFKGLNHGGYK